MFDNSCECRWFLKGACPASVRAWFCTGAWWAESEREDRYLALPGSDHVGLKLRAGRLQIKARVGGTVTRGLAIGIAARCDRWVRWTAEGDNLDAALDPAFAADQAQVIAVTKRRQMRKFAVPEDSTPMAVDREVTLPEGCFCELAEVQLAEGERWWTIALETFGPFTRGEAILNATAHHMFVTNFVPAELELPASASASYPEWIAGLIR